MNLFRINEQNNVCIDDYWTIAIPEGFKPSWNLGGKQFCIQMQCRYLFMMTYGKRQSILDDVMFNTVASFFIYSVQRNAILTDCSISLHSFGLPANVELVTIRKDKKLSVYYCVNGHSDEMSNAPVMIVANGALYSGCIRMNGSYSMADFTDTVTAILKTIKEK